MKKLLILAALLLSATPAFAEDAVFTLYRDSPYIKKTEGAGLDPKWQRVHVATFDAQGMDADYNRSHCERVRGFYEEEWRAQSEEKPPHWSNFWCEEGRYRLKP